MSTTAGTSIGGRITDGRWVFIGKGALPDDPIARDHERRGRRWLVVSYLFCPCHIPLTLALLGAAFGGTAIGAAVTGQALRIGVTLTAVYALVLWRGFREIRKAKQIEAGGGTVACTSSGCDVVPLTEGAAVGSDETDVGSVQQSTDRELSDRPRHPTRSVVRSS